MKKKELTEALRELQLRLDLGSVLLRQIQFEDNCENLCRIYKLFLYSEGVYACNRDVMPVCQDYKELEHRVLVSICLTLHYFEKICEDLIKNPENLPKLEKMFCSVFESAASYARLWNEDPKLLSLTADLMIAHHRIISEEVISQILWVYYMQQDWSNLYRMLVIPFARAEYGHLFQGPNAEEEPGFYFMWNLGEKKFDC